MLAKVSGVRGRVRLNGNNGGGGMGWKETGQAQGEGLNLQCLGSKDVQHNITFFVHSKLAFIFP